ncbi:MAG TPA: type III polyketide synthase [Acidobacteriaceae bacterium]|jgi:alpha-pyrone synthase|nr:type III polyketide synthase [Acidobacteriaceae bacterium]
MSGAYINRIATSVPEHDVHAAFVAFADKMLEDERMRAIFLRMAAKAEIGHRYSTLQADQPLKPGAVDVHALYRRGSFPSTAQRMELFEKAAPVLARCALDKLALKPAERERIQHVIVTCCTGFYAPGLDFEIVDHLGLSTSVERTMVGFMGCYAAINALKLARHIVRSEPRQSVLMVNLELCTLHLQETQDLSEVLSFLVFGDGCAASLITSEPVGLEIDSFHAMQIEGTRGLITWRVGDIGFDMLLSGRVPGEIGKALRESASELTTGGPFGPIDLWAVHPGGRSILDAVENGLGLAPDDLQASRSVLSRFGNMSSATVMFVLQELMREARAGQSGCAISFGPGLTAETMRFHAV